MPRLPQASKAMLYRLYWKKLDELHDLRSEAASTEYTELGMRIADLDFNELDRRLAEARLGKFPPEAYWRRDVRERRVESTTVSDVPEAKGNFTW